MPDTNFEYTRSWLNEEDFPHLGFSRNWENPADYPTYEPEEAVVRKDMQSLHDETKDYINNELIPAVVESNSTEAYRTAAETARAEAETGRAEAETARVDAETARVEAETARVDAETARAEAETARAEAEANRAEVEQSRVEAEVGRVGAEADRAEAEAARTEAEAARAEAEAARVEAENGREGAEEDRAAAEAARQQAEQQRADENAGIVAQATEQAVNAAGSAESARGSAQAASQSAGNAATSETNAKTSETNAKVSETNAAASASAAKASKTAAETAEAGAKAAQAAAETAAQEAKAAAGGDYLERSTYDPQGKKTDIFAYVEEHGGAQSDWNQNDETAKDYVKNRTHWAEKTRAAVVSGDVTFEKLALTFPSEESGIGDGMLNVCSSFPFYEYGSDETDTYYVIWDGTEYECNPYDGGQGCHIGGDGYPFLISDADGCWIMAYDADGNTEYNATHTISVYVESEEVHKLDAKYLPEFVINVEVGGNDGSIDWYNPDVTMAQIDEAYDAGLSLVLNVTSWIVDEEYYRIPLRSKTFWEGQGNIYTFECDDFAVRIMAADESDTHGDAAIEMIRGAVASEDALYEHNADETAHSDIRELANSKAPMYTYGTTDLTAGSSSLATGALYFVYE